MLGIKTRHFTYLGFGLTGIALAASSDNLGTVATQITTSYSAIGNMMSGTAYLAGMGFGISAVFKFKQHKDNPTQIPISTPFALMAVAVTLMFLPNIYAPAGSTLFGSGADAAGFTGDGSSALPGNSS